MKRNKNQDAVANLYAIADELQAIGTLGLEYVKSDYDKERYEKVLAASRQIVRILDGKPVTDTNDEYRDISGHISPLLGVDAAVFRNGEILLIKRRDNGLWATPGGMVEVGETLTQAVLRELREETGLVGKVAGLLGIFDSRIWKSQLKSHLYHVSFKVNIARGKPVTSNETTDCGFFPADNLPVLSPGSALWVPFLFKLVNGEIEAPYLDPSDNLAI
jgi:ADP-ribose pyrophosphatase YjhB (NUDIX family)